MTAKELIGYLKIVKPDTQIAFQTSEQQLDFEKIDLANYPALCFNAKNNGVTKELRTMMTIYLK